MVRPYNYGINFYGDGDHFGVGFIVEFFFLVSGYFMYKYVAKMIADEAGTLYSWYGKRIKRLLPVVVTSVIACELLSLWHMNCYGHYWDNKPLSVIGTLVASLGIQCGWGFANPGINNPIWYISVLLICYILFYVLTSLARKLKCSPLYFYIAMVLFGVGTLPYGTDKPFMNYFTARGYYGFFFGLILGHYIHTYGITRLNVLISVAVVGILGYSFAAKVDFVFNERQYIQAFFLYPSIIMICETDFIKKLFKWRIWSWLGKISFGVYIWHSPLMIVMYIFMHHYNVTLDFSDAKYMYLFGVVSVLCGISSHYLLERPLGWLIDRSMQKMKSRMLERKANLEDSK